MGFTPGTPVCVISRTCESIIVKLKGRYIMLSKQMAYTVKVEQGREREGFHRPTRKNRRSHSLV
ncbi:FeoA family protein [Sporomusa acidovorans]|uniref:FeoA domain-containing protein n=1 Tax=Sporomusa acidovorans TaxID=112900 RepID=UPI0011609020